MINVGPEGSEEKKIHLHTKIRTSTYASLLIYMTEKNLHGLAEVVDRILGEYLDAARAKAEKKKGKAKRTVKHRTSKGPEGTDRARSQSRQTHNS